MIWSSLAPSTFASSISETEMYAGARTTSVALREGGFTLLEVLVASLLLAIGIISMVGSFDPARHLGTTAELHQVASAQAEGELNRITSMKFSNISLKEAPTAGVKTTEPTYYVSSGPCAGKGPVSTPCYQWDWSSSASIEALDVAATTDSEPNPRSWTTTVSTSSGTTRISGKTYRFITWANDTLCKATACGGSTDDKRITVAVTITGIKQPVELSSLVTNPAGEYNPLAGGVTCTDQGVTVPCAG
jgi:prepilin-type N-terminal cleavage/methylation domain-containing protein